MVFLLLFVTMDQALNIYNTYVFPFLTTHKRQTRVSISAAIGLLTLYWAYDKIFRPPRQLRGIPQAPFFGILKALFTSKPIDELARITLPVANKSPSGLYMVRRMRTGSICDPPTHHLVYSVSIKMDGMCVSLDQSLPRNSFSRQVIKMPL